MNAFSKYNGLYTAELNFIFYTFRTAQSIQAYICLITFVLHYIRQQTNLFLLGFDLSGKKLLSWIKTKEVQYSAAVI